MAVLFPKKVPAFSRALGETDDLFDEEVSIFRETNVSVKSEGPEEQRELASEVIIAVGKLPSSFLNLYFDLGKAKIFKKIQLLSLGAPVLDCTGYVFESTTVVWMCDFVDCSDGFGQADWAKSLIVNTRVSGEVRILLLMSQHYSTFQFPDVNLSPPFLRHLSTANYDKTAFKIPALEQPNIITGPCAEVMLQCLLLKIPACVLINIHDAGASQGAHDDETYVSAFRECIPLMRGLKSILRPVSDQPFTSPGKKPLHFNQMYI